MRCNTLSEEKGTKRLDHPKQFPFQITQFLFDFRKPCSYITYQQASHTNMSGHISEEDERALHIFSPANDKYIYEATRLVSKILTKFMNNLGEHCVGSKGVVQSQSTEKTQVLASEVDGKCWTNQMFNELDSLLEKPQLLQYVKTDQESKDDDNMLMIWTKEANAELKYSLVDTKCYRNKNRQEKPFNFKWVSIIKLKNGKWLTSDLDTYTTRSGHPEMEISLCGTLTAKALRKASHPGLCIDSRLQTRMPKDSEMTASHDNCQGFDAFEALAGVYQERQPAGSNPLWEVIDSARGLSYIGEDGEELLQRPPGPL